MITVENNLKEPAEQRTHYIPCKIESNGEGPANVSKYFEPYIREDNGVMTTSFRGYPLDGAVTTLPAGYKGVLLTEAKRPLVEDAARRFQVAGAFKTLTVWNYDKKPSPNDGLTRALAWVDIAEAIHGD